MSVGVAPAIGALIGFALWGAAGAVAGRTRGPAPAGAWTLGLGASAAVAPGAAVLLAMRPGTSSLVARTPFLVSLALALASMVAGVGAARAVVGDGRLWVGLVLGGAVFGILTTFVIGDLLVG